MLYLLEVLMGIDILIVDTPKDRIIKLSRLFRGYRFTPNMDTILIRKFPTYRKMI